MARAAKTDKEGAKAAAGVQATCEEVSAVVRSLAIEVDAARVDRAFDQAYADLARRVKVRGFRPGKTPRSVLEKLYGAALLEDIERSLVAQTLPEALSDAGVAPVAEPEIDATAPAPGEAFRYTARVEVKPSVELPSLDGLEAKRPASDVTESDVDAELEGLRERRAELVDEPEGTAAARGHTLVVDYEGRIDGEVFEGGAAEGATLELGSGRFIPGFEEQLEGARAGEERELQVEFPADYPSEDVAGKAATFAVKVTAVRRRELPEIDDAFAKQLGDFADLAALRERIRSDLAGQRERSARQALRESLMDWILERCPIELPPGMVEHRLQQRLSMAHRQLENSLPHDELHARLGQWQEEWRPAAERELREDLVLEALAEAEGLEVDDAELDAYLEEQAREQGIAPKRLRERFAEPGAREGLRADRRSARALDHLASLAKVEEVSGG